MKESDWKQFKIIKEGALESFCQRILEQANAIINKESEGFHDRYLALYRHIDKNNEDIATAFNGHSRSNALMQLRCMRNFDLVSNEAISKLSPETQKASNPDY